MAVTSKESVGDGPGRQTPGIRSRLHRFLELSLVNSWQPRRARPFEQRYACSLDPRSSAYHPLLELP